MNLPYGYRGDGWQNGTEVETGSITLEVTGELCKQLEHAWASRSPITLTLDNMVVSSWRTQNSSVTRDIRDIVTLKQVKIVGKKEDASVQETPDNINELQKKAYLRILKDPTSSISDVDHAAKGLRFMEAKDKSSAQSCCTAGCKCSELFRSFKTSREVILNKIVRLRQSGHVGETARAQLRAIEELF